MGPLVSHAPRPCRRPPTPRVNVKGGTVIPVTPTVSRCGMNTQRARARPDGVKRAIRLQRSPIAGTVTKVEYIRGRKAPATSDQASFTNERNSITIQNERLTVVCTQIAGIVARRIVCWAKEGDTLELGQRIGLIKFSSRTDLLLPREVNIRVKVGEHVTGGETIIADVPAYHVPEDVKGESAAVEAVAAV